MKKLLFTVLVLVIFGCNSTGRVTSNDTSSDPAPMMPVIRTPDNNCGSEGIKILEPGPTTIVSFPVIVTVEVDNRDVSEECSWTVFEAQAGTVTLTDSVGTVVSEGVLQTLDDWMTEGPVRYKAVLSLGQGPKTKDLMVAINEESPSGEPGQKLEFSLKLP